MRSDVTRKLVLRLDHTTKRINDFKERIDKSFTDDVREYDLEWKAYYDGQLAGLLTALNIVDTEAYWKYIKG